MGDGKIIRAVRYRVLPGTRAKARKLNRLAGACRHVWNWALDRQNASWLGWRFSSAGRPPAPAFFTLGKAFTALRGSDSHEGLRELPCLEVRYTLKRQADAWSEFLKGDRGRPKFKGRGGEAGFTIPQDVRIKDDVIGVPKLGSYRLRRRGGKPPPGRQAQAGGVQARGRQVVLHGLLRGRHQPSCRRWHGLERNLDYKAGRVVCINPARTSQTCHECGFGDSANRPSQSTFRCQACGHSANADVNAARNIRRQGLALLDGGGRRCSKASPMTRQTGGELRQAA